jgi:hypothetical protein
MAATWFALALTSTVGPAGARPCPETCDCASEDPNSDQLYGTDIALGGAPIEKCPVLDLNGDGTLTVAELVAWHSDGREPQPGASSDARDAGVVTVSVSTVHAGPGMDVRVPVILDTGGLAVAGVQTDVHFDPLTPIIAACSGGAFQPFGCTVGVDCTAFRIFRISFSLFRDGPIADCRIGVSPSAPPGTYPLTNTLVVSSSPTGTRLPTTWVDGAVIVGTEADADSDGILNANDNCVIVPNPDQADTDGDDIGDLCEGLPPPEALKMRFAHLRPDDERGGSLGFAKIRARIDGTVLGSNFEANLLANGLRVRIFDRVFFDTTVVFDQCERSASGARIRCRGGGSGMAVFVLRRRAKDYELRVNAPRLNFDETDTFPPDSPVEVVFTSGGVRYTASIAACRDGRYQSILCKAP